MTDPRRRGDAHRAVRWLWTSRSAGARVSRTLLLPASAAWHAGHSVRAAAYRHGLLRRDALPCPSVAIGNLSVGGSGKTPIAAWVASCYVASGWHPGILLRGVGGDEALVHQESVPGAIVVTNPDRRAGAVDAHARGANVLVLDDAYQRLDVLRDLNVCLISADAARAARWTLPAGPWRESLRALDRADHVVVTRKRAGADVAAALASSLAAYTSAPIAQARLDLVEFHGMLTGNRHQPAFLEGKRIVVATAIADPDAFVAQVKRTGAQVQVATWADHHQFDARDMAWLAHAAVRSDAVVVTRKDAVKLRDSWPASVREPLVGELVVNFEAGESAFRSALMAILPARPGSSEPLVP